MPLSSGEGSISSSCRFSNEIGVSGFFSVWATYEWSEFGKKEALDVPGFKGVGGGVNSTEGAAGTGFFTVSGSKDDTF